MRSRKRRRQNAYDKSKAKAEFTHAKRRAWERYGVNIGEPEYMRLCRRIRNGKAEFIQRQSLRITVWFLDIEPGKLCIAVYDKIRHRIVTFLPLSSPLKRPVSSIEERFTENEEIVVRFHDGAI